MKGHVKRWQLLINPLIPSERLHFVNLLLFLLCIEISLFLVPSHQVKMSSSSSSSSSSYSSQSSPYIVESSSGSPGVEVVSSSLGGMSSVDVKAYQALEVMKLCHNFDSIMTEELLGLVQEHYSISDSYELHAPQPRQCPYDSFPNGFGLSINELEVGL
ncbi:hypothetical protein GW17_00036763 [Ensete ventricosum]|nr:hypothetical protein GW17_00036763 [Ensete ventricosum]